MAYRIPWECFQKVPIVLYLRELSDKVEDRPDDKAQKKSSTTEPKNLECELDTWDCEQCEQRFISEASFYRAQCAFIR